MSYNEEITKVFNKAIKDELSAASAYHAMAANSKDAKLAEELSAHGDEEFQHYVRLVQYAANHQIKLNYGVDSVVINNIPKEKESILKAVQALETTAIADYKAAALCAREAKDLETEEFFTDLMKEEMGHFDDLAQYTGINRSLNSILKNLKNK